MNCRDWNCNSSRRSLIVDGVAKVLLQSTNWCVNASAWFDAGAWVVHLTGENDPDADTMKHPVFPLPFYDNMAGLHNEQI